MKKEKGFTLIELIAVVIILGLIALIAIPYFTGSMKTFRDDYYDSLSQTVESAGKEFFKDNTKYLPSKELQSSKVTINNLIKQKYINNSEDYDGNECDLVNSYVIVIKKDRTTYSYTACISCPGDDFSTFNKLECDGAWVDNGPTSLSVDLGDLEDAYIYKGTSREEAYEYLKTPVDIVRKNVEGEIIGRVDGDESETQIVYPINIDILDTRNVGKYVLKYEFQGATKERNVFVYENKPPVLVINKNNKKKSGTVNNDETGNDTDQYFDTNPDHWGQQLVFHFSRAPLKDPGTEVHDYQWYINGKWEPFCTEIEANGNCNIPVGKGADKEFTMVNDVKFRYVDTKGNISQETRFYNIRIDFTEPSCDLSIKNPDGNNNWYVEDFDVKIVDYHDNATPGKFGGSVMSGIRSHGVGVGGTTITETIRLDTRRQTTDSKSFTWYGYVEDLAGNWTICNKGPLKKDKTKPTCALTSTGTKGEHDWYKSGNPEISFTTYVDSTSEVDSYGFNSATGPHTTNLTFDTKGTVFTGYIRDKAGNVNNCTISLKRDTVAPTLSVTKTATGTGGVTARINCVDATSGCKNETHSGLKSSHTYTLKDEAGHSSSIEVKVTPVSYQYEYCEHIHHYCTRTVCVAWHSEPDEHGSKCDYEEQQYDCYEDNCNWYTGTKYE